MTKEEFTFDSERNEYVFKAIGTEIKIDGDAFSDTTVTLAGNILDAYPDKINSIVDHLVDEGHIDDFFDVPKDEIANKLHAPSFRIIEKEWCVLTYTEHELDDVHIISVEFSGVLNDLNYVTIDG